VLAKYVKEWLVQAIVDGTGQLNKTYERVVICADYGVRGVRVPSFGFWGVGVRYAPRVKTLTYTLDNCIR
jgi:hypothetical protein